MSPFKSDNRFRTIEDAEVQGVCEEFQRLVRGVLRVTGCELLISRQNIKIQLLFSFNYIRYIQCIRILHTSEFHNFYNNLISKILSGN
jgi:hypothetical protein